MTRMVHGWQQRVIDPQIDHSPQPFDININYNHATCLNTAFLLDISHAFLGFLQYSICSKNSLLPGSTFSATDALANNGICIKTKHGNTKSNSINYIQVQ